MRSACQRGFTLIDLMVGTAIAILIASLCIAVVHALLGWTARAETTVSATSSLDRLADRWDAAAASAWAIFTPANDVFGAANADGHEFDIATQDDQRRTSYRAYVYSANARKLSEYVYGSPGDAPIATGDVTTGITAFSAQTAKPSTLGDPLFTRSTIADADVGVGLESQAIGGNRITSVAISAGSLQRTIALASGTAPSSFTIVLTYTPSP
jgi:type II secretory pathway pseudopilin PulG